MWIKLQTNTKSHPAESSHRSWEFNQQCKCIGGCLRFLGHDGGRANLHGHERPRKKSVVEAQHQVRLRPFTFSPGGPVCATSTTSLWVFLQNHISPDLSAQPFFLLSDCLSCNTHNSQWLGAIANLKEDHQRWSYRRKPWNCQTPYFQVKFQIFSSFFFSVFPLLHKKIFFPFPNIFLPFLLCFSSPPQKISFPFPNIFRPWEIMVFWS